VIGRLQFFNLRLINTALASEHLLQSILPLRFKGQHRVEWITASRSSSSVEEELPSKEWIQKLWQWLATQQTQVRSSKNVGAVAGGTAVSMVGVMALANWPIIPTISGFLLAPEPLQTSVLIQPLPSSSSSSDPSLLSALVKLGCEILDTVVTGSFSSGETQLFSHSADGAGVLRALLNSYNRIKSSRSMDQWFASILPAERDELRSFLLQQPRWFGATGNQKKEKFLHEELIRFLTEMPIYPRASSLTVLQQQEKEKEDDVTTSSRIVALLFTDLCSQQQQRYLIPHDLHAALVSCEAVLRHPSLLKSCGREADGVLLDRLGVKQLTKAEFYKKYVLPVLLQLPLRMAQPVSIQLLRELPLLQQADPTLIPLLRNAPLVTTVDGTVVTVASKLYDPRNGDLMLLLDPGKNFPAGEYGPVLDQLKMLGMRTTAGRDTVLQAAKDISSAQQQQQEQHFPSSSNKRDEEAVSSRSRALLAYIDMEASRLNQPLPANSSNTTTGDDGLVGFNLDSVFSKVASFLGGDGASPTAAAKTTAAARGDIVSNNEKNEREVNDFWEELKSIPWCPVECTPPVPGLPWRSSSTISTSSSTAATTTTSATVAAPKEMRPRAETWLVCSQRLIIDGEPRSQVLLSKMGWNTPLDCEVLAKHLAAMGSAFTPPIGGDGDNDTTAENNKNTTPSFSASSLRQKLAEIVPQLYRTLATLPARDLTKVRSILGSTTPCIWIGDGFAPVAKVAMKGPLNLSSAGVYVIPLELAPFRDLLLALGISASFSAEQYIGVLAAMHAERATNPLSSTQLEQALAISTALADMHIPATSIVYLPDEHAVLRATSELMYNDAPWTSHTAEESFYFVHPVISNDVAERLGVTSLQRCLLVHNADAFPMALTGAAVEAFGQSEALTTR
jgi:sacsin